MFFRLALGNVRKSARDYAVYFITLVLGVAVFYAFNTISDQASFLSTDAREMVQAVGQLMLFVTVFLAFVLGFLMVYANNYLVKRRKQEFGLYQLLGMTRAQVSLVLFLETALASLASFVVGLLTGVLLSQLLVFVTAALFNDRVTNFTFHFSSFAALFTLGCFVLIFVVMLAFNLRMLRKVDLADLMSASRKNEQVRVRSLPATIVLGLVGVGLIGWAYYRLTRDGLPLDGTVEFPPFLVTTLIVCAGTLVFFYGLSGLLFHVSRAFHGAYYRGLNMFTVRQLSSKVNTVSVSMAVISFILFLAIMAVSGGMGICSGLDADTRKANPYDASVVFIYNQGTTIEEGQVTPGQQAMANAGIDFSSFTSQVEYLNEYNPGQIEGGEDLSVSGFAKASGVSPDIPGLSSSTDFSALTYYLMTQSDYNKLRSLNGLDPIDLGDSGYLILSSVNASMANFDNAVMAAGTQISLGGRTLSPISSTADAGPSATPADVGAWFDAVVVPDELVRGAELANSIVDMNYSVDSAKGDERYFEETAKLSEMPNTEGQYRFISYGTRNDAIQSSQKTSGMISYLAIYIGFVLVIACAAILAIQQLSSASDAIPSYRLLAELGCPRSMALRSLLVQTLAFFLLPLIVAVAHTAVALRQLIRVISLIGSISWTNAIVTTAVAFVAVYGAYFAITYVTSRGLVTMHSSRARE